MSLGGIVTHQTARVGGDSLNASIRSYVQSEIGVAIGDQTAERIKMELGSTEIECSGRSTMLCGRRIDGGLPARFEITAEQVCGALRERVENIVQCVCGTLAQTPPELAGDLLDNGIVLTGGTAQLKGMDKLLEQRTGIPVRVAQTPLLSVALGAYRACCEMGFVKPAAAVAQDERLLPGA